MSRQLFLAWKQLTHQRVRLMVALSGVAFANVLMFMQFGFQDALFDSATMVQQRLRGEVVVLNPQSTSIYMSQGFSRRLLYRLLAHPNIESVHPLYVGAVPWRNPWNGKPRTIFVLGVDVNDLALLVPGLEENLTALSIPDSCLFDELSRPEFGPVIEHLDAGDRVEAEVNRRRLLVNGRVRLGASFAADGNLVLSQSNFLRLLPERKAGVIDVGVVRLRPGCEAEATATELRALIGDDLRVLTATEFTLMEKTYWEDATAIGYIFTQGVLMGFLVGFVIVYQVLYMDVASHLPQYATLKAIGFTDMYLLGVVFLAALLLSLLGFVPGITLSAGLYHLTADATNLPMRMRLDRAVEVLGLTVLMCAFSGVMATRKLREADPAEVF